MMVFAPAPFRAPALGQRVTELTSGITSNLARQIVGEAEPAVRGIIRDERNRLAEAVIGGIPFAALAAVGYTATSYLVPEGSKTGKAAGYMASAAALALGGWWTISRLTEKAEEPVPPRTPAAPPPEIVQQAAAAIVKEAEPRVRQIVADERQRFAAAAQAGLPMAAGSVASFLATMFLVKPENRALKAVGYSAAALLLGAGAWVAIERTKEAVA